MIEINHPVSVQYNNWLHSRFSLEREAGSKRYEARRRGRSPPDSSVSQPAKRPDDKPATAWATVSSLVRTPGTRFYR